MVSGPSDPMNCADVEICHFRTNSLACSVSSRWVSLIRRPAGLLMSRAGLLRLLDLLRNLLACPGREKDALLASNEPAAFIASDDAHSPATGAGTADVIALDRTPVSPGTENTIFLTSKKFSTRNMSAQKYDFLEW
ncbi:hypothetical protein [Tranquillimonas alkanivorans]|uniref:hypothetical protein n=1 Tax=Tranquillimonas alkanivorans TaxID=441119 RepID=UPI000AAB8B44|nr:hypothetical protein [Tranquillimonas alkanivorans]